ncbi:MAG: hypothetical protein CL946_02030 [Ectothiorhodospiraceae bacterium]|nr:hypothetical protein [Ectothiorhodospiraceae bacterium]
MSAANIRTARRYFKEIMNLNNRETMNEILAPDFVFTLPTHPDPYRGPDGFSELVGMLHGCFPDFYMHVHDMVANGDTVVARWRGGGTHEGVPLHTIQGDLPANGRSFEIDGMSWMQFKDGKIVEVKGNEDTVGLLMQLGHIPAPDQPAQPSGDELIAVTHRYFEEVMSGGKLDVIPEIMDENVQFIIPTQPEPFRGHEGLTGFVGYLRSAFPDIKFEVEREVASGNKVASRWHITGTHEGEFLGAPPTGNKISDYGVDIFTFKGNKILTIHVNENDFGLMQQLGMIPS